MSAERSGNSKLAFKIAAAFALVIFSLVLLEILLRFLPPPRYSSNWVYDPVIGHRGPRSQLVHLTGGTPAHYNSFGFRSEEPTPYQMRKGLYSVFLLGDSITEATQLPWRRVYASRLEFLLNEQLGRDTEVTSFAASDYGTANQLLLYAREASGLRHDVVVLQFLGINDFMNNAWAFANRNKSMSDFSRPYLIPAKLEGKEKGFPLLGEQNQFTYLAPAWKSWRESLRLLGYFEFFRVSSAWKKQTELQGSRPPGTCDPELEVFLDEPGEAWQDSFEVTGRLASMLQEQVARVGRAQNGSTPRLLAVYVPSYAEVHALTWEKAMGRTLTQCFKKSFQRRNPEQRFLKLMAEAGVEAYSLREAFESASVDSQKLFLPDGHFSSEGHAVAAKALARLIAPRNPDSPSTTLRVKR